MRQGIVNLRTFPFVRSLEEIGELMLAGAWFDISSGELWVLDGKGERFEPVTANDPAVLAQD